MAAATLLFLMTASVPGASTPVVHAVTALAARPTVQAVGTGGPINRFAVDVSGFDPRERAALVECRYPDGLRYRCALERAPAIVSGAQRRVHVLVPDLGRGRDVVLRLDNVHGASEFAVALSNPPQTVHEIEALSIPNGGRTAAGPDGRAQAVLDFQTFEAVTSPAAAVTLPHGPQDCDRVYAVWSGASASDAVFVSAFGPIAGSIAPVRPLPDGSPVRADNLPRWLVTHAVSATRVQFIAHYELVYRVGVCAERIVTGP